MKLPYKSGTVRLASPFGTRADPITGQTAWHNGIDLVGEDKQITAVVGGEVLASQIILDASNHTSEWGNYIAILGDDGLTCYYCHLSERIARWGERVEAGQVIGIEGSTGRSTGSHLHFEVRRVPGDGNTAINAAEYLGIKNQANTTYTVPKEDDMAKKPKEWWEEPLEWAQANEIIYGDEDGNLMLDEPCTRRQMLAFLYRLYKLIMSKIGG